MKKYVIIANLDRYTDKYKIFEGESLNDSKMIDNIMRWLTTIDESNYDFSEWLNQGLNQKITDFVGIKAYEISEGPSLIPDIWLHFKTYMNKIEENNRKTQEYISKRNRQEQYEILKKEFENTENIAKE